MYVLIYASFTKANSFTFAYIALKLMFPPFSSATGLFTSDTAVAPAFFPASPRTFQIWGAAGDVAAGVLDIYNI